MYTHHWPLPSHLRCGRPLHHLWCGGRIGSSCGRGHCCLQATTNTFESMNVKYFEYPPGVYGRHSYENAFRPCFGPSKRGSPCFASKKRPDQKTCFQKKNMHLQILSHLLFQLLLHPREQKIDKMYCKLVQVEQSIHLTRTCLFHHVSGSLSRSPFLDSTPPNSQSQRCF